MDDEQLLALFTHAALSSGVPPHAAVDLAKVTVDHYHRAVAAYYDTEDDDE